MSRDGSVDWRNVKMAPGEDDPAVVAAARQIADAAGGELVGLTIGDGDASWALARGVPSAVTVPDMPSLADNGATATVIAAAIRRIGAADVVLIGDSETDPGVAVALAGILGWPALVGVSGATVRDGRVEASRRSGDTEETLRVATPVVLGVAATKAESAAPGMKEILAARKRPLTKLSASGLGVVVPAPFSVLGTEVPRSASARLFEGDPATAAAHLVEALRAEGVL